MTISPNKKVSVIIPNYNYARYLKKRINSILKQTYPIYELIILDDKSTDTSDEVIKKQLAKINRRYPELKLRYVENKQNSGKAIGQWKKGFELAEGDYVWIAEADDLCSRKFLEEVMKGFEDPDVVISYTESAIINEAGIMVVPSFRWSRDKEKTGHYKKSYIKDGKTEIEGIMAIRCTVPNVSAVVFKKDPKYLKSFDEAMKFIQVGDWYFYAKILENGKISYNRKSLNRFRLHSGSVTSGAKSSKKHFDEIVGMHKMFEKKYDLSQEMLEKMKNEEKRIKERIGQ